MNSTPSPNNPPPATVGDEATVIGSIASLSNGETLALSDTIPSDPAQTAFPSSLRKRYTPEEAIGHGGFAEVWSAFDEVLHRKVAIKIYRPDPTGAVDAYIREARTMADFTKESGVAQVFECGKTPEGKCYVVSQIYEQGDLSKKLKTEGHISHVAAASLLKRLAEALDHAHAHGIIHRDVKPGNILLNARGEPVLTDFGLALRGATATHTGTFAGGTPQYASPEQARGEKLDDRSDIFSLGVVMYQLLTEQLPTNSNNISEQLAVLADPADTVLAPKLVKPAYGIPESLNRICLKAMKKDPQERYQTARAMADDLGNYLDKHAARWTPWQTATAAVGGAGILATLTVAGVMVFERFNRPAPEMPATNPRIANSPRKIPPATFTFERWSRFRELPALDGKEGPTNLFTLLQKQWENAVDQDARTTKVPLNGQMVDMIVFDNAMQSAQEAVMNNMPARREGGFPLLRLTQDHIHFIETVNRNIVQAAIDDLKSDKSGLIKESNPPQRQKQKATLLHHLQNLSAVFDNDRKYLAELQTRYRIDEPPEPEMVMPPKPQPEERQVAKPSNASKSPSTSTSPQK